MEKRENSKDKLKPSRKKKLDPTAPYLVSRIHILTDLHISFPGDPHSESSSRIYRLVFKAPLKIWVLWDIYTP